MLFEAVEDGDNPRVAEPGQARGLIAKLSPCGGELVDGTGLGAYLGAPSACSEGKELLDGHRVTLAEVTAQVGDAETAPAKYPANRIDPTLELCPDRQGRTAKGQCTNKGSAASPAGRGGRRVLGVAAQAGNTGHAADRLRALLQPGHPASRTKKINTAQGRPP